MAVLRTSPPTPTCTISKNEMTSLNTCLKAHEPVSESPLSTQFHISRLPAELRNEIYRYYFASLLPLPIMAENLSSELHQETQLSLSSPYFKFDILPSTFYSNCTFSFSSPKILRQFAGVEGRGKIARVRIEYGELSRCNRTDWVFLLFQNFEKMEEVTFVVSAKWKEVDAGMFDQWWKCVRDAMREASNSRVKNIAKGGNPGVLLKVEYRECDIPGKEGCC